MLTTYEYDDQGRVTRAYTASSWTDEDRVLMLAWKDYQSSLCGNCGQPKATAWHPDNDGWFEVAQTYVCHGCTALARASNPDAPPTELHVVTDTRDYEQKPLPPMPTGPRLDPDELAEAMGGAV